MEIEYLVRRLHLDFDEILQFLPQFMAYLKSILTKANPKMNLCILHILEELMKYPQITEHFYLPEFLDIITDKLGETSISLRKSAAIVFSQFVKMINHDALIPHIVENLSNPNWRIREEMLHQLITFLLAVKFDASTFDFDTVIRPVAILMNDVKAKIRFVAIETLVCLAKKGGRETVVSAVCEVVDEETAALMTSRLRSESLPVVKYGYIEFPQ